MAHFVVDIVAELTVDGTGRQLVMFNDPPFHSYVPVAWYLPAEPLLAAQGAALLC